MDALAIDLMRLFALALGLPETYFDSSVDRSISRLRVRNYPAPEEMPGAGPAPRRRAQRLRQPHHPEDRGPARRAAGAGQGRRLARRAASARLLVVNIGDMLARWTNDRWVSTLHRVVNPPLELVAKSRRRSVVFFQKPNYDALVSCLPGCTDAANPPKYAPTTSGGHLREKFVATQQGYA